MFVDKTKIMFILLSEIHAQWSTYRFTISINILKSASTNLKWVLDVIIHYVFISLAFNFRGI